MSPAVVSTASPSPIGARSSDSRCTSGPPARAIAAATPPPCLSSVLAALAIASTSSFVTSARWTSSSGTRGLCRTQRGGRELLPQLLDPALARVFVVAPAQEASPVADPVARDVVEGDLD